MANMSDCPLGQLVDTKGRTWVPAKHNDYQVSIDQVKAIRHLVPAFQGPLGEQVFQRVVRPHRVTHMEISFPTDAGTTETIDGWRVKDSTYEGKGGIRANDKVDVFEVAGFSAWMTRKARLAGVPFGGAKGGIRFQRDYSEIERGHIYRGYIEDAFRQDPQAFGPGSDVPAPDGGTGPAVMRVMLDQMLVERLKRGTIDDKYLQKKLLEKGALTLHGQSQDPNGTPVLDLYLNLVGDLNNPRYRTTELASITGKDPKDGGNEARGPATGLGVYFTIRESYKHVHQYDSGDPTQPLKGQRFAILGFGNVGASTGINIEHKGGGKVTRVVEWMGKKDGQDTYLVLDDPNGIDTQALATYLPQWRKKGGEFEPPYVGLSVTASGISEKEASKIFITSEVDALIPAGFGVQFSGDNLTPEVLSQMRAHSVYEAANGPVDTEGDSALEGAGKQVYPGPVTNQGGMVVSILEYNQNLEGRVYDEARVNSMLDGYITESFAKTWQMFQRPGVDSLREAADVVAIAEYAEMVKKEIELEQAARSQVREGAFSRPLGSTPPPQSYPYR